MRDAYRVSWLSGCLSQLAASDASRWHGRSSGTEEQLLVCQSAESEAQAVQTKDAEKACGGLTSADKRTAVHASKVLEMRNPQQGKSS